MPRWLFAVLMVSCSSPRREPAPAAASGSAAPALDAASVAATPDAAPPDADPRAGYPDAIAAPTGCALAGRWREQPGALALAPGGAPYAEVRGTANAEVTLGDHVYAALSTPAVRLAGYVDAARLRLHAARPFAVGELAVPGPKLALRFVAHAGGQVTFELPLPAFAGKQALRGERACDDLAIDDRNRFDPREAIEVTTVREAYLHAKRSIPLARAPGEPPAAQLRYADSPHADVLEERGKLVRVAIATPSLNPAEDVLLVGWVPASALHTNAHGFGGSWATGGDRGARRPPPRKDTRFVACPDEIPLAVELGGERRTVGSVITGAVIEVLPGDEDLVAVRLPAAPVELAEGARWLVTPAALANCAATTRP